MKSYLISILLITCFLFLNGIKASCQENINDTIVYISASNRVFLGDKVRLKKDQVSNFVKIKCNIPELTINRFRFQGCNRGDFLIITSIDDTFTKRMKYHLQKGYVKSMLIDEIELVNDKGEVIKSNLEIELKVSN